MQRACLVFNPAAGRGDAADLELIRAALAPKFEIEVFETSKDCDADACARRALERRPDIVIASGGDGTVSLVAGELVGTGIPLGIVPRGTASSVATALGIPDDIEGSCAAIIGGRVQRIDTARCNGRVMVLLAAVGFHADAIVDTSRSAKNQWGLLAYVATGIEKLRELAPFEVELETEDKIVHCRASAVTVANLAPVKSVMSHGPSVIIPDDGLLDVTIVAASSLAEAVATGLHLLRCATQEEAATRDNVGYLSACKLRIVTGPEQTILIDGEEAGTTPLDIECMPRSLAVIVPEVQSAEREPEEKLEGLPELEVEDK
jgi:YegS/Rv2252/BmrU family lipid kinase